MPPLSGIARSKDLLPAHAPPIATNSTNTKNTNSLGIVGLYGFQHAGQTRTALQGQGQLDVTGAEDGDGDGDDVDVDDDQPLDSSDMEDVRHREAWTRLSRRELDELAEFEQLEKMVMGEPPQVSRPLHSQHDAHSTSISTSPWPASRLDHGGDARGPVTLEKLMEESVLHGTEDDQPSQEHTADDDPYSQDQPHRSDLGKPPTNDNHFGQDASRLPKAVVHAANAADEYPQQHELQSNLLKRLFPGVSEHARRAAEKQDKIAAAAVNTEISRLKQTIQALEDKVADHARANKALKQDNADLKAKLAQQDSSKTEFEVYRQEQLRLIQAKHDENIRILKKERLLWERHQKASQILPSKKERQEMDALRAELLEQFKAWKDKETRMMQTQDRLNRRIDELSRRNAELLEEVKTLEQERARFVSMNEERSRSRTRPAASGISSAAAVVVGSTASLAHHGHPVPALASSAGKSTVAGSTAAALAAAVPVTGVKKSAVRRTLKSAASLPTLNVAAAVTATKVHEEMAAVSALAGGRPVFDPAKADLDELERSLRLGRCVEENKHAEGKRDRIYECGTRLVWHVNGSMKQVRRNGLEVVYFSNGDHKTIHPEGHMVYWYDETRTLHTSYPDGYEMLQFESGQIEKRHPDGTLEVCFPDRTRKITYTNGEEEVYLPDGQVHRMDAGGNRTVLHGAPATAIQ
ncbi:T-complex protein 10 C-terminus-domain-containing protein [Entophlyctis helioformis]|nr:T-complex protein 10 C-terminus-domain-containing protein [Entophlyctis helioformis]